MTKWIDDDGQEYGFDTHDMHLFADEALTMELSIDSISKKALAEIIGGEPIIRCEDCKKDGTSDCAMAEWLYADNTVYHKRHWNKPQDYCSWAERKEQ